MRIPLAAFLCASLPLLANAQMPGDIKIEVAHGNATDFSITPLWFGFHNGLFDTFDVGSAASASLEAVAELGDTSGVTADFTAAPGIPGNFQGTILGDSNGVPPIEPGETATTFFTPANPSAYSYFSYLSMVVPSNDAFIGNDNPFAYEIFNSNSQLIDANGNLTSEVVIPILGSDIYDAGTEVNGGGGAAFFAGESGPDGIAEGGLVTLGSDLSSILGGSDPTGRVISDGIAPNEVLATITISVVPEPTSALLALLGGLGLVSRRR